MKIRRYDWEYSLLFKTRDVNLRSKIHSEKKGNKPIYGIFTLKLTYEL